MDIVTAFIILLCQVIIFLVAGLLLKNYLPSYIEEKAKNLATKEDIQDITRMTEAVQEKFKQNFEMFSSDVRFKYEFYYKQYSELYSKLYAIIMQSEYVRHYIKLTQDQDISFNEAPFLEISKTHKTTFSFKFDKNAGTKVEQKTIDTETPISQFNKIQICDYIIENGELASQKLLKLAVSYRFAHSRYEGNPDINYSTTESQIANEEEFRLIKERYAV